MVFLEISPRNDNKSNSYNSTKDTLHNTQAQLRDPHINTSESGKTREEGRGGEMQRHGPQDRVQSSLWSQEREGFRLQVHFL